jgi:hypothetical protein
VANLFGPIAVAWHLAGGRLSHLDGELSLVRAEQHRDYPEYRSNRGAHLGTFAHVYGPVLSNEFVHALLGGRA